MREHCARIAAFQLYVRSPNGSSDKLDYEFVSSCTGAANRMQPSIQISVTIPTELASRRVVWKYLLGESETSALIAGERFAGGWTALAKLL